MQKRMISFVLTLVLTLLLCACTVTDTSGGGTDTSTESTVDDGSSQSSVPEEHSELYIPEYSSLEIFDYFEEVALNMEYGDGTGNFSLVQKWTVPIRYRICGTPTEADLSVLADFFSQLNRIKGFPGIYAADDNEQENLTISFLEPEAFSDTFSELIEGEDAYGAAYFWFYTETNEIHTAHIGYRTDIDQTTRTSVLIEEIVNTLGISDTVLREDSIVYQYSNDNTSLSAVDWVILKLLYDPMLKCGLDADSCKEIILKLYY